MHGKIVVPGAALMELSCAVVMHGDKATSTDISVIVDNFVVHKWSHAMRARMEAPTRLWCVKGSDSTVSIYGEYGGNNYDRMLHAEETSELLSITARAAQADVALPKWVELQAAATER